MSTPSTAAVTTTPTEIAAIREALDIAHDLAIAEAARVHEALKGYKPHKHAAVDADVAKVAEAAAAMTAVLSHIETVTAERDAAIARAEAAEKERDAYRAGNTALLEALMDMANQHFIPTAIDEVLHHGYLSANKDAADILVRAGVAKDLGGGIAIDWAAVEARKPQRKTWEQAVNECITDPKRRAELLAMGNSAPAAALAAKGETP